VCAASQRVPGPGLPCSRSPFASFWLFLSEPDSYSKAFLLSYCQPMPPNRAPAERELTFVLIGVTHVNPACPLPAPLAFDGRGGSEQSERLIISPGIHDVINAGTGRKCSISSVGRGSWREAEKKWEREHRQQRRAERQQPWASRQTSRPESVSPPPPLSLSKTASDQELFQLGYIRVT